MMTQNTLKPDDEIRAKLRPNYAENTDNLTAVSGVVTANFQTVAKANNYWK